MRPFPLLLATAFVCTLLMVRMPAAHAAPVLLWQTTFNCGEWNQSLGLSESIVCGVGDGISGWGSWVTAQHPQGSQITPAATNPTGGGGRGFRLWRCDGFDCNSSALSITVPTAQSELWIRWYMRYQAGFNWAPTGQVGFSKEIYMIGNSGTDWTSGFVSTDAFRTEIYSPSIVYTTSVGWQTVNAGTRGDGKWHCYEVHVKMDTTGSNGLLDMWIDGTKRFGSTTINFGTKGVWQHFLLGENANNPSNGSDNYVDYDDVAVSAAGY